ncbi:sosondowah [Carabus blaptoides fortunei]
MANGGYTALHIAMQFGRKEISELLIDVYHAQRDIRDWSGRTAEYYSTTRRNTTKSDNYHKMKIMKKSSEKDLGFLRIGSLNVRVKKTTEAFSNFLGVGGSSGSITPIDHVLEKVHKSWGSADNVSKDNEMAAPKLMPHNKRKLKYTQEQTTSYSTPGTPNQKRALPTRQHNPDSDSDTACGFDSNWKQLNFDTDGQCLRNIRLIFPQSIQEGDTVTLFCLYDLEGEPLYSVKWYRGRYEIFRYLPRDSPRIRIFQLPGLNIDIRGSNSNRLTITNVPKHLGGNYTCEVSADEPVYTTRYVTEYLQVIPNNKSESIENFIKPKKDHGTNGSQSFYFNKFNVIKFVSMYVFICVCEMDNIIYFKSI